MVSALDSRSSSLHLTRFRLTHTQHLAFVIASVTFAGLASYRRPWETAGGLLNVLSGALVFSLTAGHRRRSSQNIRSGRNER